MVAPKNSDSISIPIDKLGHPGAPGGLLSTFDHLMKTKEDESDAHEVKDQGEREFHVTAALSRQPMLTLEQLSFEITREDGGSFFSYPPGATGSTISTTLGTVHTSANNSRQLSVIEGTVRSTSFHGACEVFQRAVQPFLDNLSYALDVPVSIKQMLCVDKTSGARWISFVTPYRDVQLTEWNRSIPDELMPVCALYREAKNSTSSYYRLLCYFKLLEGIYGKLRPAVFREAREKGVTIATRKELVPDHPELQKAFSELIGRPIKPLLDKELQQYRNAVAHAATDDGGWLVLSDYATSSKYGGLLVLLELCCRVVIDTQEAYLREVRGPTTA